MISVTTRTTIVSNVQLDDNIRISLLKEEGFKSAPETWKCRRRNNFFGQLIPDLRSRNVECPTANVREITLKKPCNSCTTVNMTHDHLNCHYWQVTCHFIFVVCGNASILHYFRDITIFTVHITVCNIEKVLRFNNTLKITSQVHFLIHT